MAAQPIAARVLLISFNFPSSFYDQIVESRAATGHAAMISHIGWGSAVVVNSYNKI
jgi:hypothetical protein